MIELTPEQKRVIEHEQGDILVSASAGSGKTHVMISRIVRLILQKKTTVDRILATTFTEAAASEMKEKLKNSLKEKVAQTGDEELAKQIPLVGAADVCTVHSFCSRLVRAYFFKIGIAPDFKVLDEDSAQEYVDSAMKTTFEDYYAKKDAEFLKIVDRYAYKRSDIKLREMIFDIYSFCSEEADFNALLDKSIDNYTEKSIERIVEEGKSKAIARMKVRIKEYIKNYQELSDALIGMGLPKTAQIFKEAKEYIESVVASDEDWWVISYKEALKLGNRGEKVSKGSEAQALKSFVGSILKSVIAEMQKCQTFMVSASDLVQECAVLKPHTEKIVEVVKAFRDNYSKLKREENYLDFSDLQYFALEILYDESIRKDISEKYEYIFVDEYQDVNAIQETIINLIGRNNVFMVGDDKQSIYAFRGCRSEFFTQKLLNMDKQGKKTEKLNHNFRSAKNIINEVNKIFNFCMTERDYGINYKDSAKLTFGKTFPDGFDGRVTMHRLPQSTRQTAEKDKSSRIYNVLESLKEKENPNEKALVSQVVKIINDELLSTYYSAKEKQEKRVTLSDIVILIRARNASVSALISGLVKRGIPVISDESENLMDNPEVATLVDILSAIDCAHQDVPLASTLKSPLGGFTNEDLYMICNYAYAQSGVANFDGADNFVCAYKYYMDNANDELADRLKKFNENFVALREYADFVSCADVLEKVLEKSNYYATVYAKPYGKAKISRVKAFVEFVKTAGSDISVHAFLKKLASYKKKIPIPTCEDDDAVRVMTMHKSKGLEFPVVIAYDLDGAFNKDDASGEVLKDRNFGFAFKCFDDNARTHADTYLREVIKNEKDDERVKENLRLFYVALTRATYSLHLVYSDCVHNPVFNAMRYTDFIPDDMLGDVIDISKLESLNAQVDRRKVLIGEVEEETQRKFEKVLSFEYPFKLDTDLPLKSSVTEAMQRYSEENIRPLFEETERGQTTEDGITAHKILECFDFCSGESVIVQTQKLIEDGVLTEKAVKRLKLDKIQNAINSGAFDGLENKTLYREKSFIASVPAKILIQTESEEEILVQGIIDLLVIDNDGAMVIDYKYTSKTQEALKNTYSKQLNLYAYVVEKTLGIKVKAKKIISLLTGEVTEIE